MSSLRIAPHDMFEDWDRRTSSPRMLGEEYRIDGDAMPPAPLLGQNASDPNGFVEAAAMTSRGEMPLATQYLAEFVDERHIEQSVRVPGLHARQSRSGRDAWEYRVS